MGAKEAFEEAAEHIVDARLLFLQNLRPQEWPHTFHRLQSLLDTFTMLAQPNVEDEAPKDP